MHIVICGSLSFVREMDAIKETLQTMGHTIVMPLTADLLRERNSTFEQLEAIKNSGQHYTMTVQHDAIRKHYHKIVDGDAILVVNWDKKGITGYVGGNTFLEMGFAHVLNKEIYLLYDLPDLPYADEMRAMQPVVLEGDLTRIKNTIREERPL